MPHVLVADGDSSSLQANAELLEQARYHVSQAKNGRDIMRLVSSQTPDLVLMDVVLPDQDGLDICRRIRRLSDVPIVFLSHRARPEDKVEGLRNGADDYVAKPCQPAELIARVNAVLRRAERSRQPPKSTLAVGAWELDPIRQTCLVQGSRGVELTPREVHLLSFLMKRSGRVCTNNQIVRHVWGFTGQQARSIVATSMWRLRAKLESDPQDPRHLLTIRNVGYKFVA